MHYWVEFRNVDGTLACRVAGETRGRRSTQVEGRFSRAGKGTVVLHLVQADGL